MHNVFCSIGKHVNEMLYHHEIVIDFIFHKNRNSDDKQQTELKFKTVNIFTITIWTDKLIQTA